MDNKELLNLQAEQLQIQGEILDATESWWSQTVSFKISEHSYLKEKLTNKWNEEDAARMNQLEKDIEHLQKKASWEQREMTVYQEKRKNFEKTKEKLKFIEFTRNINNINKLFHKEPPK